MTLEPIKLLMVDDTPENLVGLGLGLFICQQIAEAHGGDLTVESTAARRSARTTPHHTAIRQTSNTDGQAPQEGIDDARASSSAGRGEHEQSLKKCSVRATR